MGKIMDALVLLTGALFPAAYAAHLLNVDATPHDAYPNLHLPRDPPLYPAYSKVPKASFNCADRERDTERECQAYHLYPNATLFHDRFKVCDHFYSVRCGWDSDDL